MRRTAHQIVNDFDSMPTCVLKRLYVNKVESLRIARVDGCDRLSLRRRAAKIRRVLMELQFRTLAEQLKKSNP